jgi:hypothetical protein
MILILPLTYKMKKIRNDKENKDQKIVLFLIEGEDKQR